MFINITKNVLSYAYSTLFFSGRLLDSDNIYSKKNKGSTDGVLPLNRFSPVYDCMSL